MAYFGTSNGAWCLVCGRENPPPLLGVGGKRNCLFMFSRWFDIEIDARFVIYTKNRSSGVFGRLIRSKWEVPFLRVVVHFPASPSCWRHVGACQPRQRQRHEGWLAVQWVVREDHQAQSALGAESFVEHNSVICLGLAEAHPAQNDRSLTSQAHLEAR